jgi:NADPH:quinone reductase-like Zn-dependent oxidoreductase
MKAAIMYPKSGLLQYGDVTEPKPQQDDEVVITVKAAAIKHLDKSRARSTHYSTEDEVSDATIIGGDGVGILPDGTRVYAMGETGMAAEKAVIDTTRMVKIPDQIDDATAAALPNAVIGSAMGLRFRAGLKKGETVLINGATSFTGKIAVQIAKYYGAGKIIVTGRNEETLQALLSLGADEMVSLKQNDKAFVSQLTEIHKNTPIDIIIDYLWGHSAEMILSSLKGKGSFTHKTRFVSIGSITGDIIQLSAANLRSVDLIINGSGLGSWTREEVQELLQQILPEMFTLAAEKKLAVDTVTISLQDIEKVWDMPAADGKRLVVIM